MSHPQQRIRFCTSHDGTRIAYATCGSGPPLVWAAHWVHHLELDWDSPVWRPWLSLLTRRHTLIRYDVRGCGLSDREGVEFSLEKHAEDIDAVVQAAGLKRFVLLGVGGGAGAVAMMHTVKHPEQVSQLVLYACQVRGRLARSTTTRYVDEAETRLKVYELGWPNETLAYGQFFTSLHMPDAPAEQMREYNHLLRQTTFAKSCRRFVVRRSCCTRAMTR